MRRLRAFELTDHTDAAGSSGCYHCEIVRPGELWKDNEIRHLREESNPRVAPVGGVAAIIAGQIACLLLAYWARVETFIVQPGRFREMEPFLGSDFFVFTAPFGLAIISVGTLLSRRAGFARVAAYSPALLLAAISEAAAMFVAVNTWGT